MSLIVDPQKLLEDLKEQNRRLTNLEALAIYVLNNATMGVSNADDKCFGVAHANTHNEDGEPNIE